MVQRESIAKLLKRYGLRPQKGLGQNFLSDPGSLDKVIQAAEIKPADTVLEIGPGLGSLTSLLAQQAERVVAVELDTKLFKALQDILQPYPNVELIQADILEVNLNELFKQHGYLVVANIPYYLTSAIIRQLLEAKFSPYRVVLTIQKEVAERICAEAGDLSLLALSVQVYGNPYITNLIPSGAFYPVPKVDSAIVRIDIYPEPFVLQENINLFFALTKAGFSQKRKTLHNALSAGMHWEKPKTKKFLNNSDIDPKRRAQTLSLEEWKRLVDTVKRNQ